MTTLEAIRSREETRNAFVRTVVRRLLDHVPEVYSRDVADVLVYDEIETLNYGIRRAQRVLREMEAEGALASEMGPVTRSGIRRRYYRLAKGAA